MGSSYQFADTGLAASRLDYLAEVYAPITRQFVRQAVTSQPAVAIDLGCGPGHTTHLLAEVTGCHRVLGLDFSEHFIAQANRTKTDHICFAQHDVTELDFPAPPADLLFCRYLLTHLRNPASLIEGWASEIAADGRLLIQEVESIQTEEETFLEYLEIVEAMLRSKSQELYVGPVLDSMGVFPHLTRIDSAVSAFPVKAAKAAKLFHMNIQVWKQQPFITENYSGEQVGRLQSNLHAIMLAQRAVPDVIWGHRQLVFQKC